MTGRSAYYDQALTELEEKLKPMLTRRARLRVSLRQAKSTEFILANNITREDVEMSRGDGVPWFYDFDAFGQWLRDNSIKKWAEWNGRIFLRDDVVNGEFKDVPGMVDSLPKPTPATKPKKQ